MQVMRENNNESTDNRSFRWYRDFFKRVCDVAFSLIAIVILVLPMLVVALLIKMDSPEEPILFKQTRVGKNNIPFTILKFRSMSKDAPHQMATENFENPEAYITSVGKVIRKTSLDELPQLFNVLKGDMSIIGPRPLIPAEKKVLMMRNKMGASRVLPGITGLAQIHGRDEITDREKATYDGKYASNINAFLDISIFLKTIFNVILSRGVHEGKKNLE